MALRFWWPRQNKDIHTATPRRQKVLVAPQPNPQFQHNYGAGHSINYVPADWRTYQFKHILQIVPLPRAQAILTCTCGLSAVGLHRDHRAMFAELWQKHCNSEQQLRTLFETLHISP